MLKQNKIVSLTAVALASVTIGVTTQANEGLFATHDVVKAAASDMAELPKGRKLAGGQEIPGKYSFHAKIIPGITKISAFGDAHWATSHSDTSFNQTNRNASFYGTSWLTFDRFKDVGSKGKLGVYYQNVGTFDGHIVNAKVTILDWSNIPYEHLTQDWSVYPILDQPRIGISTDFFGGIASPGDRATGYSGIRYRIDYTAADTGKPLNVSGYYTFHPGTDSTLISPQTFSHITDVYYTGDTRLNPYNIRGWQLIYPDREGHNHGHAGNKGSYTLTYDNMSSFEGVSLNITNNPFKKTNHYLNGKNLYNYASSNGADIWQVPDSDKYFFSYLPKAQKEFNPDTLSSDYDPNAQNNVAKVDQQVVPETYNGGYVRWDAAAIGALIPKEPKKFVADSDEGTVDPSQVLLGNKGVDHNTLKNRYEHYHYAITHRVQDVNINPGSADDQTFKSYIITDNLDKVLDGAKNVKVFDDENQDVTYRFNIQTDNNQLKVVAKSSALSQKDFYNENYKITFDTSIKPGVSLADHQDPQHPDQALIKNQPTVTIDDDSVNGNVTKTNVPFTHPEPTKSVSFDGNGNNDHIDVDFGKNFKYRVDATAPDNINLDKFAINDKIEDVQRIKDVKVYDYDDKNSDGDPKDITNQGKLSTDDNNVKWVANDASKWHGKHVKMIVEASVKNTPDLLKYLDKNSHKIMVPNKATVDINDKPHETNTVHVTPLTPKASLDKKIEVTDDNTGQEIDNSDLDKGTNKEDEPATKKDDSKKSEKSSTLSSVIVNFWKLFSFKN